MAMLSNLNSTRTKKEFAEVSWKDLKPPSIKVETLEDEHKEFLQGYQVPNLKHRMDIYKNFPIILRKCSDTDVERYAVEWNRTQYECFRQATATSKESHASFDFYAVYRLIYALRMKHGLYKIEPPRSTKEICVLAMQPAPLSEAVIRSTKEFMLSRDVNIPSTHGFPGCGTRRNKTNKTNSKKRNETRNRARLY
jgi:hypothetical protein